MFVHRRLQDGVTRRSVLPVTQLPPWALEQRRAATGKEVSRQEYVTGVLKLPVTFNPDGQYLAKWGKVQSTLHRFSHRFFPRQI